ncbi:MAG TPA: hypothetical protein P5568_08725 [Acidobacteriota bacterium]|nr:hypothetical protein [Acidobacteriota bacterium]HRV08539.1 hypothetical protein [Acidobacteriota bacterium]
MEGGRHDAPSSGRLRVFRLSPVVFLILLLFSFPVQASEVSGVFGFASPDDLEVPDARLDFRNPQLFGFRYEKDFLFILGLEQNLVVARRWFTPEDASSRTGFYYLANGVINFPVGDIVPNLVVGIGFQHQFGEGEPDLGTSFLSNWGVGVKFRELAGPLGFRIDYRRLGVRGVQDETVTTQELTVGFLVTF